MALDDGEHERVLALSHLKRMRYLMKTIAERRELWTLARDGEPVVLGEAGSPDAVPVWPDSRFAADFAREEGDEAQPLRVPVDDWLAEWIPRLRAQRRVIALFPLASGESGVLDTWQFEEDLRYELEGPLPLP